MWFLEKLGLVKKPAIKRERAPLFSQESMRRVILTRAGNRFFKELDHPTQQKVSTVFAGQDANGLRQLIATYDGPTVEAMALALDDAVTGVIGAKSLYHGWVTGILQRGEQSQSRPNIKLRRRQK